MLNKSYTRAFIALFLTLTAIVGFGCSNGNTGSSVLQEGLREIVLADVEECDLLFPDNLPDSCHFIALETNDNCLIENIRKIEIVDSLIFVQDATARILVFDLNGRFKNQIGAEGRGHGEYFSISTFYVDALNGRVVTVDNPGNSFLFYDYIGNFINEVKFDDVDRMAWGSTMDAFRFTEGITSMGVVNDSLLLMSHYMYKDFDYYFSIMNLTTKQIVNAVPQMFDFSAMAYPGDHSFMGNEKFLYVKFSDTVYRYASVCKVEPAYLITSSLKRLDTATLNSWSGIQTYDFFRRVSSEGYSRGVLLMQASDSHLLLHCMDGEYQYRVVVDLNTGYVTKTNLSFFAETDRAYLPFSFQSTWGNGFVAIIKPMDMLECADDDYVKGHPELNSICATLNEDDNPIVGIYFIK